MKIRGCLKITFEAAPGILPGTGVTVHSLMGCEQ